MLVSLWIKHGIEVEENGFNNRLNKAVLLHWKWGGEKTLLTVSNISKNHFWKKFGAQQISIFDANKN